MIAGLVAFVVVVFLNVAGLLVDLWLRANDLDTITDVAWDYPGIGLAILALQLIGTVGLAVHFFGDRP